MANGSFEFGTSGYLQGKIDWYSTSNGSSANSSNVTAILYARRTNSYTTTGTWSGNINIAGNNTGISYYSAISNNWVELGRHTITASHNNDGTLTINISGSVTGPSGTSLSDKTSSGSQNVTLDTIPRQANIISGMDFNDEQNPTITFTNPANFRVNLRLEFGGTHIQRDNVPNTGSYTFNLTNAERDLLRSKCQNSNYLGVRETVASYVNSSSENAWSWHDKTMSIINANPTFSNFTFEDTNATTTALTGNNQNIIPRYSNVKATISTANKATALKSATMSKYRFTVGNSSTDITYSDSASVNGTINNVENGTFNVYAIDSRNNSTLVTKLANQVINYSDITLDVNSKVERSNGGVGGDVTLTYSGTLWNGNFGSVSNSIVSTTYQFKKTTDTEWITGTTNITPTISGNTFSFSANVRSNASDYTFDIQYSYDFRITITDELSTKTIQLTPLSSGTPNLALADNGVAIMGKYDETLGGYLQVAGSVIGRTFSGTTAPTSSLGEDGDIYLQYS